MKTNLSCLFRRLLAGTNFLARVYGSVNDASDHGRKVQSGIYCVPGITPGPHCGGQVSGNAV
jgi:hypothetical protein